MFHVPVLRSLFIDLSQQQSTISAIAKLLNDIYSHINRKLNSIIFLDFKKAFDTVSHLKLLNKLKLMGMDVDTLLWFESYLSGRQQCVKLNGNISSLLPILYGIPQGSILGPILFSIYINEIADVVDCGIVLYADDTVIYHHDRVMLQENLNKITKWCNNNLLTINDKKSQWMKIKVCGEVTDTVNLNIGSFFINNLELPRVDIYKYMGVLVNDNSNFQKHHIKLVSNLQLKLLHFRRIRRYLTTKAAILVYKCTILPLMEYADFICDQGIAYVNKSTQKLQNMGSSIAFNQHILPMPRRILVIYYIDKVRCLD